MNDRLQARILNAAADDALHAAMEAFGTPEFPLLLTIYHRAMENACSARIATRTDGRRSGQAAEDESRNDLPAPSP